MKCDSPSTWTAQSCSFETDQMQVVILAGGLGTRMRAVAPGDSKVPYRGGGTPIRRSAADLVV